MVNNSTKINKTKQSLHSDVNISINMNKTKESLNSYGQQFYQYQQNRESLNFDGQQFHQYQQNWESLKSDDLEFHQYQQNKRKFKQWRSSIPPILTNQNKVYTVMVYNSTNINKPRESLHSDGLQFHQYQQKERKFKHWWSTIPPIATKQRKV